MSGPAHLFSFHSAAVTLGPRRTAMRGREGREGEGGRGGGGGGGGGREEEGGKRERERRE